MIQASRCPCRGDTLDRLLQPAVLSLLAEGEMSGYALLQRLSRLPLFRDSRPDPTGIYRCLHAMEKRKLLTGRWEVSESGPARRVVCLTPAGRTCLKQWVGTLKEYRRHIDGLLRAANAKGARE